MPETGTIIEAPPGTVWGARKADVAYHSVRRYILLGQLKPGTGLLEQKIAAQLKCSQGTVREALMRLEQDGLVTRRGYRGTMVSQPSVAEAAEMARIRIDLECLGIRKSAGSFSKDVISTLADIADQMEKATQASDYYRSSELDREFHMTVFKQAGFPALEPILNRCALHVHRFTYMNAEKAAPDRQFDKAHRELARTFARGDPANSESALRNHIERVLDRFAPLLIGTSPQG